MCESAIRLSLAGNLSPDLVSGVVGHGSLTCRRVDVPAELNRKERFLASNRLLRRHRRQQEGLMVLEAQLAVVVARKPAHSKALFEQRSVTEKYCFVRNPRHPLPLSFHRSESRSFI